MPPGRPATARPTRQIRVSEDLAEKLAWLSELGDDPVAEIVDPLLRPEVDRRYAEIENRVEIIKAAKAGDPGDVLQPDTGGEG